MTSQRIAFLILAHNAPHHMRALLESLRHRDHVSFVHVDRKSDLQPFTPALQGPGVILTPRIPVYWGDFSIVRATLMLIKVALEAEPPLDRFVLISGTDYPLYSATEVNRYFREHAAAEFIQLSPMISEVGTKPLSRLTDYNVSGGFGSIYRRLAYRAGLPMHIPMRRNYANGLKELTPHTGSQWWALSRAAVEHVVQFVAARTDVCKFFENSVCPDEMFFHTILAHSPFAGAARRQVTFADWSAGSANPAILTRAHLPYLLDKPSLPPTDRQAGSRIIFARKFPDQSNELVEAIRRGHDGASHR